MDSLKIQDAFEPYYAGRNRVAVPTDERLPAETDANLTKRPARGLPMRTVPTTIRHSDNEPQSMTEH
ncbi:MULTISPECIES: hypothetical protein [unclassified Mesorhizobium]|uniref:hypothetical protein n=1 Tax=unclassified Mesorhizobium TaxID=325217 RepID=UPI001126D981|nr:MULTISPECIES: hypothetical protein [unclassified Mesorhizobium]TPN47053.1 hypothetical protein FJ976_21285 [Mesorhizobium sp. B1-1-9]TPN52331.1 hypothetical protein FJ978_12560 [Mesorhizobium sp. B1-1-7]